MEISIIERARRYIANIYSIAGSGGHTAILIAAVSLVKGFNLPEETALELLLEWNSTNTTPPWTLGEIQHKIREAAKSKKQTGYLLDDVRAPISLPPFTSPKPAPTDAATKVRQREQWPAFRPGTEAELRTLAKLRKIDPGIPWLAQKEGLLQFTASRVGDICYALTEGTLAQFRRLDGQPFTKRDGSKMKSMNLPGSVGKWLGYGYAERHPAASVLIVEGLIAWLEAAHAITNSDYQKWIPFAALSSGVKLETRELDLLANRRVIIARDRGSEGATAAVNWQDALNEIGTAAPIWTPPSGTKDLGETLCMTNFNPNSIFKLL